jgi:outer membrane protein assembly factor BamA
VIGANPTNCSALQLLGSRVVVANAELRFPLIRRIDLGFMPVSLPPLDGLFFYDAGLAWSCGQTQCQTVYGARPSNYDVDKQRYPLRSYGFGLRLNLFNYAILRWDYAVPVDQNGHRGVWTWSLWPSF